jgi:hypothetical protein
MMKYALVLGERICQIVETEGECFPVSPELQWVPAPDDATVRDRWQGGALVKEPVAAPVPKQFVARTLLAQLSAEDYQRIVVATQQSAPLGLLWASLLAQGDAPIKTESERFQKGWRGLAAALGAERATAIAAALDI